MFSLSEAAKIAGVPVGTIYQWISYSILPVEKQENKKKRYFDEPEILTICALAEINRAMNKGSRFVQRWVGGRLPDLLREGHDVIKIAAFAADAQHHVLYQERGDDVSKILAEMEQKGAERISFINLDKWRGRIRQAKERKDPVLVA